MSIPSWLSVATYNRFDGSYVNDNLDVSGNIICRGTNSLWIDTNASIKLNGGTVVTLSNLELQTLDGITTGVSIQSQINGKATTGDVTNLQTKTQNITATSVLTTIEDNVTLSNGNLDLTAGDLTISGTKSFFMNGELNLGSTGRISGTGLTISNAQLIYLNGLTANIESRLASVVTKTQLLTSSASLATFSNAVILTTGNLTLTAGNLTLTNGDLSVISGKSILCNGTLNFGTTGLMRVNGVDITNAQLSFLTGITASVETRIANNTTAIGTNTTNISNNTTAIGTNTTDIANNTTAIGTNATNITNLQNKTANITNATGGSTTLYQNNHSCSAGTTFSMLNASFLNINGTARILLNGTSSYIEMATSRGILATGNTTTGIFITGTEMSYLDGATSNIQTQIGNINTSLTDLNLKTSDITYVALPPVTSIANAVSLTGSLKVAQQAWLDGAVKLKTTYVAPVSGELGFTVTSSLSGGVLLATTNVVRSIVNITLGIGVWIITYNCFVVYGSGTTTTSLRIGLNTTSSTTTPSIAISTEANGAYTASKNYNMTQIVNVSATTTYYLSLYSLFSISSLAVDGGNSNTTELKAIRVA